MIKIEKTYGIKGVNDFQTRVRVQELIALSKQKYGSIGKVIIDAEKITYYKFGIRLGINRLSTNGLVVNENGIIRDNGPYIPDILDNNILNDLCTLFDTQINF